MLLKKEKKGLGVRVIMFLAICGQSIFALTNVYAPESTSVAVQRIASRLVAEQETSGALSGAWGSKSGVTGGTFTGTMAAGLAEAYWLTCNNTYKTAAENAGYWILDNAPGCALYYDEVYAFMQLSQIACDPSDNIWRTALEDFYGCIESQPADPDYGNLAGTELYTAMLEYMLDPEYVVFEVAYYTVGAYYIDTADKEIWRSELIRLLEAANTPNASQVMALGVATWALAQVGDLDSTAVYVGASTWDKFPGGVATTLAALPDLLETYQVPSAYPTYHEHFYSVYDPPNAGFSGWTETNIYAVMGLDAAAESDSSYNFRSQIDAAWAVNMQPVDYNGDVWYNAIPIPGEGDNIACYHYAGEYLQYLAAARLPGDVNLDDSVDILDLDIIALNWIGNTGCNCSIADLNHDRSVNLADFARFASGWLLAR